MKGTCTDHNYKIDKGRVSMSTDWVDMLGIQDFLEFDDRFLWFECWHHSKKDRNQGCLCSWTLQMGKNSYYEFLVSILSGLLVDRFYDIWSLVLCRLSDTGLCRNSRQSHRPNTTTLSTSSAFIGIRSYTSIQPSLGAQFHTSCIFYKFPVRYLECKGQASGKQLWIHDHTKCRRTVSMSTDWVGVLSILDFLVLDGRILWFASWHRSKKGRRQGCFCSRTLQIGKNS